MEGDAKFLMKNHGGRKSQNGDVIAQPMDSTVVIFLYFITNSDSPRDVIE